MNITAISGRLVYEPELKETNNGTKMIKTRIAVSRNDKNKTTDFFSLQIWDKRAEFVAKYFKKGDPIEITGKLQTQNYTKQDGTNVNEVVIVATDVNFCLSKRDGETSEAPRAEAQPQSEPDYSGAGLPFEI